MGSYAIDFGNEDLHTRIGVGIGFMFARINQSSPLFRGDANDPFIAQFNAKQLKLDGSIGIQIEKALDDLVVFCQDPLVHLAAVIVEFLY